MKKNIVFKTFYIYLLLQPMLDLVTSLMTKFMNSYITIGLIIRGVFLAICVIYILFFSKSKYVKKSRIFLCFLFLFSIIYFCVRIEIFNDIHNLVRELIYMTKYYYTPIFIIFIINFFDEYKLKPNKILKILLINLFTYSLIILIANLTGTAFVTYESGFGNTGWFYSGNEISNILTILFPIVIILVDKYKSYFILLFLIPIVFVMIIIGTKTSYVGLIFTLVIFSIYFVIKIPRIKEKIIIISVLLLISLIFSGKIPVVNNIKNSIFRSETSEVNKSKNEIIKDVVFSRRDLFKERVTKIYNTSTIEKKLFGVGFVNTKEINNESITKLIEMDFYDIFYRYGLIGFMIYFIPFIYLAILIITKIFKLKFRINKYHLLLAYSSLIGVAASFLVGHVLGAPAVSTYLGIIIVLLNYYLDYEEPAFNEKKITILNLHLGRGGIEKYLQSLCEMLISEYEIEFISTYKMEKEIKLNNKVKIHYLINDYPHREEFEQNIKKKNIFKVIKSGFSLLKILIVKYYKNIKVISELNSKYIITTRIFHNNLVGKIKDNKTIAIATEHNYHDNDKKYVKKLMNSCDNVNYLIVVTEELLKYYQEILKNKKTKCIYIPNTINKIDKYKKKTKISYKLVSVGRLVSEKGFEDLIDIIFEIKNNIPNIKLDIYGDGPLKAKLQDKIKSKNLETNIELKGSIENQKLLKKLEEYDMYLMSSITESFGIVLLEAMSKSLACIAFDSASGARQLLCNKQGILVENRNIKKYSNEVIKLLNNIDLLNKTSYNGHNSINKYDMKIVKEKWIKLFNENI